MRSTVQLAQYLSGLSPEALERLLAARFPADRVREERFPDGIPIPHFTDLALRLLAEENLTWALRGLTSADLHALATLAKGEDERLAPLVALGLVLEDGDGFAPLPEVQVVLDALITEHGNPTPHHDAAADPVPADEPRGWVHDAFAEGQQAVLVLAKGQDARLRVTRAGELSKVSIKFLTDSIHAKEHSIASVVTALRSVGVLELVGQELSATPEAATWMRLPHPERWLVLAAGVLRFIPAPLRTVLTEAGPDENRLRLLADEILPKRFPFLEPALLDEIRRLVQVAEDLALTRNGVLVAPVRELLTGNIDEALALTREAFPSTVQGVYLQPDLTVVSPGPLDPRVGLRLLELTELTAPGLATSMRFTEQSLHAALDEGWTADDITSFLTHISLTPIPQPLEYLLADLSARHGTIAVRERVDTPGASEIIVTNDRLARELPADSRLSLLALTQVSEDPAIFTSRVAPAHVLSVLAEARYTATRSGHQERTERTPLTADASQVSPLNDEAPDASGTAEVRIRELLRPIEAQTPEWIRVTASRLTASAAGENRLDIEPLLELAAKSGETLLITVTDGKREHTLPLTPVLVSKGRLRAVDPKAQLERTLSMRAITRVEPLTDSTEGAGA